MHTATGSHRGVTRRISGGEQSEWADIDKTDVPLSAAHDASGFDLAIIGGGINGCGIARDAAGQGWHVHLCDQADLGAGTSSASSKLIHGGLRYLEHYEFRLVREALAEREVLWGIAPHLIRPMRFVLPHDKRIRSVWKVRLGLFIYDHLGGRTRLPPTRTLRLREETGGDRALKDEFALGFEYSDCWVDDARLVILNALDAAEHGATIEPRTACVAAERSGGWWHITLRDEISGHRRGIRARVLINAAGPWIAEVAGSVIQASPPAIIRLVKGSHIVVPRLYDHQACYVLQNADGRIVFVMPYEGDFTLIGTTEEDFSGDVGDAKTSAAEIDYLCRSASAYLRRPVTPDIVHWSYAGVRPLVDDGSATPQQATRDYALQLEASSGEPALLSVLGGKITTYRRLAELVVDILGPFLPAASRRGAGWTRREPLPGGDFAVDEFDQLLAAAAERFAFLPEETLRRLLRAYGTRVDRVLNGATCLGDLGDVVGADLTEAELRYLVGTEWARTAEDVVWRRSKLGLRMTPAEVGTVDDAMRKMMREAGAVA